MTNALFNPRQYPALAKEYLRLGWARPCSSWCSSYRRAPPNQDRKKGGASWRLPG